MKRLNANQTKEEGQKTKWTYKKELFQQDPSILFKKSEFYTKKTNEYDGGDSKAKTAANPLIGNLAKRVAAKRRSKVATDNDFQVNTSPSRKHNEEMIHESEMFQQEYDPALNNI